MPPIEGLAGALPELDRPLAVIFRHDHLADAERLALANRVRVLVQARGHLFFMARSGLPGADGFHGHGPRPDGVRFHTAPAHNEEQIAEAIFAAADAVFLSPLHRTQSHVGVAPLPPSRALALAQACRSPVFALGGMNGTRADRLHGTPFQGFGAIGAFVSDGDR